MIGRKTDRPTLLDRPLSPEPHAPRLAPTLSDGSGWASTPRPRRRPTARRIATLLLLLPFVLGLLGAPAGTTPVQGDELSDARVRLAQQKKEIAEQKKQVKELEALQNGLTAEIAATRRELKGINADLRVVKRRITRMVDRIGVVQSRYDGLVTDLGRLDRQLLFLASRERVMKEQLRIRQGLLAERIRSAYDTDRTSLLESMLSGRTFTDMLTQMSYFLDVGEQDKALAQQISRDQEAIAAVHETVESTRDRTDSLRLETAAQKRKLDASLKELKAAKAELRKLEKETERNLRIQRATYAKIEANKKDAKKALAAAATAQKRLAAKISAIVAKQTQSGNIPSEYNGTLRWPMSGLVTQNFGCTGFSWEPPLGDCDHFHRGIDIVAPEGTKVRSSGSGVVAYIGWNYADGADPAWIVIIAHSSGLQTWYAHMRPAYPGGIKAGSHVNAGQIIGYEGNTGHSTGAHLHWAVMFNGNFVNPRLFL